MIEITNAELSGFLNPIVSNLFNDPEREFPIDDAFKLADLLSQIQQKAQIYQSQARKIIEGHGGKINPDGGVEYPENTKLSDVQKDLGILNSVVVQFPGERIKLKKDSWPKLTLMEAFILKPIVENGDAQSTGKKA